MATVQSTLIITKVRVITFDLVINDLSTFFNTYVKSTSSKKTRKYSSVFNSIIKLEQIKIRVK